MKKNINKSIIFGLILVAVGIVFAGNELGFWDIDIFFSGWWTLFIIVPCIISIVQNGFNTGNIIGLCIGVFFLLQQQQMFYEYRKLIFPIGIIAVGLVLILRQNSNKEIHDSINKNININNDEHLKNEFKNDSEIVKLTAIFSGHDCNKNNEVFSGADLAAIFGGLDLDIRNAHINKDVRIDALCLFGGMDIFVPQNISVKVHSTCIFGGIDNFAAEAQGSPTIYINCTCIFGGIDIRLHKNKR